MKTQIRKQIHNLNLDLEKYRDVKGVEKQITDSIRSVTQEYQHYTITKSMKKACEEFDIEIPDIISQTEKQKYSRLLKKKGKSHKYLRNNSFLQIEHYKTIQEMKKEIYNFSNSDKYKVLSTSSKIDFLLDYFRDTVTCFFKLATEIELNPNTNIEKLYKNLVVPQRTRFIVH